MVKENLRILVVDDEKDYCEVLKMILENNGYVVETCFNGKEALDILEERSFDVVVSDLSMPVMDGFGVLEYLVQNKYIDDVPVFIISADTSDKSLSRAYDLGAADVIAKPFNIRFVRRRINNIIELYDQRRYLSMLIKEKGIDVPFMKTGAGRK